MELPRVAFGLEVRFSYTQIILLLICRAPIRRRNNTPSLPFRLFGLSSQVLKHRFEVIVELREVFLAQLSHFSDDWIIFHGYLILVVDLNDSIVDLNVALFRCERFRKRGIIGAERFDLRL